MIADARKHPWLAGARHTIEINLKKGRSVNGRTLQPWPPAPDVPQPRSQLQKLHLVCATFFITIPCASKFDSAAVGTLTLIKLVSNKLTN